MPESGNDVCVSASLVGKGKCEVTVRNEVRSLALKEDMSWKIRGSLLANEYCDMLRSCEVKLLCRLLKLLWKRFFLNNFLYFLDLLSNRSSSLCCNENLESAAANELAFESYT